MSETPDLAPEANSSPDQPAVESVTSEPSLLRDFLQKASAWINANLLFNAPPSDDVARVLPDKPYLKYAPKPMIPHMIEGIAGEVRGFFRRKK